MRNPDNYEFPAEAIKKEKIPESEYFEIFMLTGLTKLNQYIDDAEMFLANEVT